MTEKNNKEQVQFITLQKATRKRYEDKQKTKTLIKFFVLIKSMRQHKPKSIQITKVFNPLKSLYHESQTLWRNVLDTTFFSYPTFTDYH